MSPVTKFILISVLVGGAMLAGYLARRVFRVRERVAEKCMWFVVVFGYPSVSVLSVWQTPLSWQVAWLPVLATVFMTTMTFLSLGAGRLLTRDRPLVGLFGIAGGLGNTGFTMGAFLCFMFFGKRGIGLAAVHDLAWAALIVFVMYPIARHYAEDSPPGPLWKLLCRSLFDIRSISLPATLTGLLLSLSHLPVPPQVEQVYFIEIMMFTTTALAYFSIGLRLHVGHVLSGLRLIVGLGVVRFAVGPALGLVLAGLTFLTPWPVQGVARAVFHVETCIPTAVTMVAIANLFHLRPREASALFVVNTVSYLAICVPALMWVASHYWGGLNP